jgi:toxin ParE1/3/4
MRKVRIHQAAALEAVEAAAWYELQRPGLGVEFDGAVQAALDLFEGEVVPLTPAAGSAGKRGAMRLILKRFPYDIVVFDHHGETLVLAVAHHSRRPGYWRNRQLT